MDVDKVIWEKFHIHKHDTLPFSPWLKDPTRSHLVEVFAELGYTRGAEIGVASGEFSLEMCQKIPGLHLICVDPWETYDRVKQDRVDWRYKLAQERLSKYSTEFKKMISMKAVEEIPDESLDFVYLDGLHDFDNVVMDIIEWSRKVRKGGIVSGHDYYEFFGAGVIAAVRVYTQAHNIQQWYVTKEKEASWFFMKG